jgi:hypothetical protein
MRKAIEGSSSVSEPNTSFIDRAMRAFAAIMVIWSIGVSVMLLIQARSQPTRFMLLNVSQEQCFFDRKRGEI